MYQKYRDKLTTILNKHNWEMLEPLIETLYTAWQNGNQVYICGNGGSGANANHMANDFVYGVSPGDGKGIKASSLSANPSILTCIANDVSYEDSLAYQLRVHGNCDDVLIVLSGSGNSPNIIKALETAKEIKIITCAILGFSGGKCKELADIVIHFPADDMQIAEDLQQIVGHMVMRSLKEKRR
jgi:D-sedoheptulose 7-phosphate isomerase